MVFDGLKVWFLVCVGGLACVFCGCNLRFVYLFGLGGFHVGLFPIDCCAVCLWASISVCFVCSAVGLVGALVWFLPYV